MNSIERTGKFYYGGGITPELDNSLLLENAVQKREEEAAAKLLIEIEKQKQAEVEEKLERLELIPLGNKVVILPYVRNPYLKVITKSGIFTGFDRSSFMNPDSGEQDSLKEGIMCAKVIEIGPDCKWIKNGDDIFYDARTVYVLPFLDLGYKVANEANIICAINEDLKTRLNLQ